MGTPVFAVPALQKLLASVDHQVVAVFTQSPKPKGRGLNEIASPVHNLALQHNIPVYTPFTLKSDEVLELINSIESEVIVVVAYGFLIPKVILQAKKYGCLNIHPSNLPRHRGAAPLQRTIIEGDSLSSVCIIQMDEGLDTGDILLQQTFTLPCRITLPILHDQCAEIGANLLLEVLRNIASLARTTQPLEGITYASKLKKEEGKIDWRDSAYRIDCKIRGMNPWPGVYFEYNNKIIKILEAEYQNIISPNDFANFHKTNSLKTKDIYNNLLPGTVINDRLFVACGTGILIIKRLQHGGKKVLNIDEFVRGEPIPTGTILN
ncbi:Methionyl-tRNA formyltransferase [Pseudolycoriella hygida]|uniref:Methionyl-tRNA formyltransferase, mitochondrial n=1 Tax=Pseudolycoriella hygida TaxID=35572 RepID=A0A9Q0S6B5_9DIPT|nr:Methionyl-tRNA formyltransferase [Pseudolycoriella hygida]